MSNPLAITRDLPTHCPHCRCRNVKWNECPVHFSVKEDVFCGCDCKEAGDHIQEVAAMQHILYVLPYFR